MFDDNSYTTRLEGSNDASNKTSIVNDKDEQNDDNDRQPHDDMDPNVTTQAPPQSIEKINCAAFRVGSQLTLDERKEARRIAKAAKEGAYESVCIQFGGRKDKQQGDDPSVQDMLDHLKITATDPHAIIAQLQVHAVTTDKGGTVYVPAVWLHNPRAFRNIRTAMQHNQHFIASRGFHAIDAAMRDAMNQQQQPQ